MADTLTNQLKITSARKSQADADNYGTADTFHGKSINKRTWRKFKYSWRRLFKQNKFYAVSAVAGKRIYCNYLGPSGVTLLAVDSNSKPVLTWLRYPVSFRRRSRYLDTFAKYGGEVAADDSFTGKDMLVYTGDEKEVEKYIYYLNNKAKCIEDKATDTIASICCNANKWA